WLAAAALDRPELLAAASLDVVHTSYREPLVPGLSETLAKTRAAGAWAAFLSGAGPTIGVVTDEAHMAACMSVLERFAGSGGRVMFHSPGPGYLLERPV